MLEVFFSFLSEIKIIYRFHFGNWLFVGSSLPPVVCRRARVFFALFVFVCAQRCPTHIVLCLFFVYLHLVYSMLLVSLDCLFLISPSVFSNVYLSVSLDCLFLIAPSVFSNLYLSVSLDCLFLIAPSVFSNLYLSVSLDCFFLIPLRYSLTFICQFLWIVYF